MFLLDYTVESQNRETIYVGKISVPMAPTVKNIVFWDMAPYGLGDSLKVGERHYCLPKHRYMSIPDCTVTHVRGQQSEDVSWFMHAV